MIRTLQKRFTVTAMIAVTVLLVLLLGGINLFNALSVVRDGEELLSALAAQKDFGPAPRDAFLPWDEGNGLFRRSPDAGDRMSALTFSVRFDAEGALLGSDLSRVADLSEEEAVSLARQALDSGKASGRIGSFRYQVVRPAPETRTVVFLDMSRQTHELLRVAALSGLGGIAAWLAMLLLVRALSRRAIRPIAENMERQRRFITDAGHELKTPLAIIRANAEHRGNRPMQYMIDSLILTGLLISSKVARRFHHHYGMFVTPWIAADRTFLRVRKRTALFAIANIFPRLQNTFGKVPCLIFRLTYDIERKPLRSLRSDTGK